MILVELTQYKNWVLYGADKVPINALTFTRAKSNDPTDWTDFETACNAAKEKNYGVGFVLDDNCPYSIIDLDDVERLEKASKEDKKRIAAIQKQIAEKFAHTYAEISPSGKGLHIWCKGKVNNRKTPAIEVYSRDRYFTYTANRFNDKPIVECQQLLDILIAEMGETKPMSNGNMVIDSPYSLTISDEELFNRCKSGKNGNGEMFLKLWYGEWKGAYPSESEADLAFINIVAFYTDDKEQVAKFYYESNLFKNSKKQKRKARKDYLFSEKFGLVHKAFDQKPPLVDFTELLEKLKSQINTDNDDEQKETLDWSLPPGLMGNVISYIYANAIHPNAEIAIASGIAYMSAIGGKAYNTNTTTGLNQYIAILAKTGAGKEGGPSGMERLTNSVRPRVPAIDSFFGPREIASAQGLVKQLVDTPSMLSYIGEIGMWLQKLTGKYAKSNEISIRSILLDLYGKSGAGQILRGSVYSDKSKNVPSVESPAFSLCGDSTPKEFYKALDEDNIAEGLVSRFTVIEASEERPKYNQCGNKLIVDDQTQNALSIYARKCLELCMTKSPLIVQQDDFANKFSQQCREYCTDQAFKDRESNISELWNRAHLRWLRLAALVATGVNPEQPIITEVECLWAWSVIEYGMKCIQGAFENGKTGQVNYEMEQRDLIEKTLYKYKKSTYDNVWEKNYGISKEMFEAHIITWRYLQLHCLYHKCFKMMQHSAFVLKNMISDFEMGGKLQKIDMGQVRNSGRKGLGWYIL